MLHIHSIEKTESFFELAVAALKTFGLPPTPENYELWFVYYSEAEPEVKNTIDRILDQQAIDNETCLEIHKKFLRAGDNGEAVENAGLQIQKTIEDVSEAVSVANEWIEDYGQNVQKSQDELSEEKSRDEINKILSDILGETSTMLKKNANMKELLRRSTMVIQDMHRDLELARKEAITDGLTGLANRKSFDVEIQRLSDSVVEGEISTFSLLMVDIDHFKIFNDTFGHQVGDQVLKLLAKTLDDGVKGRDIACRYGGEEFSVLLPDTALEESISVAESIRKDISSKDIVNRLTGDRIAKVAISVGVAENNTGEKPDQLITRADEALYMAKDRGRNQVVPLSFDEAMKNKS